MNDYSLLYKKTALLQITVFLLIELTVLLINNAILLIFL